jgi:multiple inositol-polyphosphate phosphatase/2,3-bisphosphoglycerate 3-phosphatase
MHPAGAAGSTVDGQGEKGGEGWEVDRLTRFFDVCPQYTATASKKAMARERSAFVESHEMEQVLQSVKEKLHPRVEGLTRDDLSALYTLCGFEVSHLNNTGGACGLLGPREAEVLEYAEDLKHFYKKAYGLPLNAQMACPLHERVVQALRDRASGLNDRASDLIFAHGETLVPLMTRLGLFSDRLALTASLTPSQRRARKFRSGMVNPMAANLLFVLYECSSATRSEHLVLALHNEQPVHLPFCSSVMCRLEELEAHFRRGIADTGGCDFEKVCGYQEERQGGGGQGGGHGQAAWPTAIETLIAGGATQISPLALALAVLTAFVSCVGLALFAFWLAQRDSASHPLEASKARGD